MSANSHLRLEVPGFYRFVRPRTACYNNRVSGTTGIEDKKTHKTNNVIIDRVVDPFFYNGFTLNWFLYV